MNVRIVGAGQMGLGIAHVFAAAGHHVELTDVDVKIAEKAKTSLAARLTGLVTKGRLQDEEKDKILAHLNPVDDTEPADQIDVLLEAVAESLALKQSIFATYDERCKSACLFASNTSSLSLTALANGLSRPDKVVGMHFFNPPPVMGLVEVVAGAQTSEATLQAIEALARELGKEPVRCEESPGFIVNRLLIPMLNEACDLLDKKIASKEAIDTAMKLGANHPMGPLALADLIGLDVCLAIMETLQIETGDPKYRPSVLLKKMVRAGELGRKTKRGFYDYG